jgi:chromosome partitioning protein
MVSSYITALDTLNRNQRGYKDFMVVAIASQKGGTGKTTTSIQLAAGLARRGERVLLVDIDSQANASKVLLKQYQELTKDETIYATIIDRKPLPIHQSSVENLDVAPSHILLSNTDVVLTTAMDHREARLKAHLDPLKDDYDYIFIDCPPALSWLTLNAFTAADRVLMVVSPGYFELDSINQLSKTVKEVHDLFNPSLKFIGILFTMSAGTINSRTSLQVLRQGYADTVLNTVIPRNTDISDALYNKQDIFTYSPRSYSAEAYRKLIEELFP